MKTTLILACAGKGARVGYDKNKLLVKVNGSTCLERTLKVFLDSKLIDQYIVTSSPEDFDEITSLVGSFATVVLGGATRTESIKNALRETEDGIVLIHDGARPFVDKRIIADCIASVNNFGSAVTAYPSRDTVIRGEDGEIKNYLGKSDLYSVQTPQAFFVNDIKKAYDLAGDRVFNDDGEVYMQYIAKPHIVNGNSDNVKITFRDDMSLLDDDRDCRFGVGFDSHKLVDGRKLILGGIEIPHSKGLLGHSDADVLTHAIMDAILSALAMRDIGYHFSDKDPKYKDADSMKLLEKVLLMAENSGYKVKSISASIMAEKPKLLNYIPIITENLASALSVPPDRVGLAATTLEGLGFVGREEGICVHATAVVVKR
ncbi:MAG: 2-C-methyl-D-erythritol 2,4-cyclodiphosphate synthase [Clostridiales bacterium]|nr:2-C-methyl-D-erythritol 2,4-cyclodiphosphate synthase [Clostridiales bacterium]